MIETVLVIISGLLAVVLALLRRSQKQKEYELADLYQSILEIKREQEKAGQDATMKTEDIDVWVENIRRDGF